MDGPRRFLLVRHARTVYNAVGRLNGDPTVPVHLDDTGREQALALRPRLRDEPIDLAAHTRHVRTRETLDLLLDGRRVPRVEVPELDDIRLGGMEGRPVLDYRAWRRAHGDTLDLPGGGESRWAAVARFADGFERLLEAGGRCTLAVLHDVPIRALANAAAGEHPLYGPVSHIRNASLREFGEDEIRRGVRAIRDGARAAEAAAAG